MSRRRFNQSERIALYLASDGKCANCGAPLPEGWHADHIEPYSKGGSTDVYNGQALCPKCNLEKGAKMITGKATLREFQSRFVDTVLRKLKEGKKADQPVLSMVADVHPGSGKTIAALAAADRAFAVGYINRVVVFAPRLNLAQQFETDWNEFRLTIPWAPSIDRIIHQDNASLTHNGTGVISDGYVTTYSSLVTEPELHLHHVRSHKTLVIVDEADRLGADENNMDFTKSAEAIQSLAQEAVMVLVMSGTPFRADDRPLLFGNYRDNGKGDFTLIADISATYRDGVRDGYLRRFDFRLNDGIYTKVNMEGETELSISMTDNGIGRVLEQPEIYEPMVDTFVRQLREQKQHIHPDMCGLIACNTQSHARKVMAYVGKHYPELRALVAVSEDGSVAHHALKKFRDGGYDVLVTVSMAYIGYDHKPISVLLLLTSFRSEAYLRQLVARGLRVWKAVPLEKQFCLAVVPDDPLMAKFVEALRGESEHGYQERLRKERPDGGGEPVTTALSYIKDAFITTMRAMGLDPSGDMTPEDMQRVQRVLDMIDIPRYYPLSDLLAFARGFMSLEQTPPAQPKQPPRKTHAEEMKEARNRLESATRQCDKALNGGNFGGTNARLYNLYGMGVRKCKGVDEIDERLRTVTRWLAQGYYDDTK